eukprot:CAMPEP_0198287662 /NCGR_PEP_ID=MMETSP1449-20131203/6389_1 /TAXON_ID=420275 /ORGANISM="Attheya septentrionalis, Strain CCMP2084" /LENGTH=577 /DNA_ID=CAMNT_0043985637 /DNA_START=303 /DNA_END=2036 /DNA_ORIENTATION=+
MGGLVLVDAFLLHGCPSSSYQQIMQTNVPKTTPHRTVPSSFLLQQHKQKKNQQRRREHYSFGRPLWAEPVTNNSNNQDKNNEDWNLLQELLNQEIDNDDDYDDDDFINSKRNTRTGSRVREDTKRRPIYDEDYNDVEREKNQWYEEEIRNKDDANKQDKYNEHDDEPSGSRMEPEEEDLLEWERVGTYSWVLWPDPAQTPTSILHFVGGAAFGSLPRQCYAPLLEGICTLTHCIVVCTPLVPQKRIFSHLDLAADLTQRFQDLYHTILEDEYAPSVLATLPIVGVGHSLGSRLLTIMATHTQLSRDAMPRAANILIAFNNYNAQGSIPGMTTLLKQKRQQQKQKDDVSNKNQEESQKRRTSSDSRYNDYDDDEDDGYYYEEDEEEDELDIWWNEMTQSLAERGTRLQEQVSETLTPQELEFFPSPDQLWDSIGGGRYAATVPRTLVVQFDRDEIDQSSRLARSILQSSSDNDKRNSNNNSRRHEPHDVKFARLSGEHLTPVTPLYDSNNKNQWLDAVYAISSTVTDAVQRVTSSPGAITVSSKQREREMEDLILSISRYFLDVILASPHEKDEEESS